jgi:hypothetical protein
VRAAAGDQRHIEIFNAIVALDPVRATAVLGGGGDKETVASLEESALGLALRSKNEVLLLQHRYFDERHLIVVLYQVLESRMSNAALLLLTFIDDDVAKESLDHQRCFSLAVSYCSILYINVVRVLLERFASTIDVLSPDEKKRHSIDVAAWRDLPELVDLIASRVPVTGDARSNALQRALNAAVNMGSLQTALHLLRALKAPVVDIQALELGLALVDMIESMLRSTEFRRASCDLDQFLSKLTHCQFSLRTYARKRKASLTAIDQVLC